MVKALRSCLEAERENQGRSLDPQKKPQENSYRIFYSLKYIPYTHSTCRIYSLLVPGILESRMSQANTAHHRTMIRRRKRVARVAMAIATTTFEAPDGMRPAGQDQ